MEDKCLTDSFSSLQNEQGGLPMIINSNKQYYIISKEYNSIFCPEITSRMIQLW